MAEGRGVVTSGRTQVRMAAGQAVLRVSTPELSQDANTSLTDWSDFPIAVGRPLQIEAPDGLPPEGVTITRSYDSPLPEEAASTLAYYDDALGSWLAVPSTLAPDRRSVSATVHHLSVWTDFVGGTQQAMAQVGKSLTDASEWAFFQVGKVFDTRVDPPQCDSPTPPSWVKSTIFIETHRNNPVHFCVGQDKRNPGLLTVKARVNRGFGFTANVNGTPAWTYNSGLDSDGLKGALNALADIDQAYANSLRDITADGMLVAPGQEFSFGLSEDQARASKDSVVLRMKPQPALPFLATTLAQLIGTDMVNKADGYAAAAIALAKCSKDVGEAHDGGTIARASLSCVGGLDESIARQLAVYLDHRGVKDAGKVGGRIVGRTSIYLAVLGPTFNGMNYWAERTVDDGAHTVHVFPTTKVAATSRMLSGGAWGPYRIGMDKAAATTLGGGKSLPDVVMCGEAVEVSYPEDLRGAGVGLRFGDGAGIGTDLRTINVRGASTRTAAGIHVGSSLTELRSAYVGKLNTLGGSYSEAYYVVDGDHRLVFGVDASGKVEVMGTARAGDTRAVLDVVSAAC